MHINKSTGDQVVKMIQEAVDAADQKNVEVTVDLTHHGMFSNEQDRLVITAKRKAKD